jgi:hypothetical protein
MGFREWFGIGRALELSAAASGVTGSVFPAASSAPVFADGAAPTTGTVSVDSGVLYGTPTLADYIAGRQRIARAEALRIPAVKRARDLICASIGQFPLKMYDPTGAPVSWSLLDQPETGVSRSITITRTVEDMLFDERGWWQIANLGWHGRPVDVNRLDSATVTVRPKLITSGYGAATVWPETPGLIRIDSPNPGLLDASPALRACALLERAALSYMDGAPPIDYFTPADPTIDPFEDDDEVKEFLDSWQAVRRVRGTGYVPGAVKYEVGGWDPEKLQLAAAREFAITEVARLTGVDSEELSVSTTSRTYANMQDRRRHFVENVLGPYMTAIEGRLSLDDVTPHGYTVAFDTSNFLRLDDLAAAQADQALVGAEIITRDEARAKRGLPPLGPVAAPATPAAVPAPQEATA